MLLNSQLIIKKWRYQTESKMDRNASLSCAKLTTSGEDAEENIMAITSACRPAKRIPEQ
jgi:hypothetical protein